MRLLFLGALLALAAPLASAQATFTVTSTADDSNARDKNPGDGVCEDTFTDSNPSAEPRCTLRAAIDEANATSGDVEINLPGEIDGSSATYTLARVAPNDPDNTYEDDNAYGDLDIGGMFSTLTLRGTGTPGPTVTQSPNDRVLHVLSGEVTIERVEITGGTARAGDNGVSSPGPDETVDGQDGQDGGCILLASGVTATFDQISVNNCATQSGGNGASPAANNTVGGAAGNGGNGGGIANYGTLTLLRSFIAQNGTGDAGSAGTGTSGDSSPVAGGAGGNGGSGGGLYNEGTLTVQETTVWANTGGSPSDGAAGTNGGPDGLEGEGGSGSGIATLNGGAVSLRNTIVAVNTAGDDVQNGKQPGSDLWDGSPADDDSPEVSFETGTFTDEGYNLIGSNGTVEDAFPAGEPNANNSLVGTGQQDDPARIDPLIQGLNLNSNEAVRNLPLGAGSPAINAGANTSINGDDIAVDGRGFKRPGIASGDMTVDIGGYEFDSEPAPPNVDIMYISSTRDPQRGDNLIIRARVTNNEDVAVPTRIYFTVDFPNGADRQMSVLSNDIPANSSFQIQKFKRIKFLIPSNAPAGEYTVTLVAAADDSDGGQIYDTDTFTFTLAPQGGALAASGATATALKGVPAELNVQVAPNPARGSVSVEVGLPEAGPLAVSLYDALGREVATLTDGSADAGVHTFRVDASAFPAGVYVLRAATDAGAVTQRMTVVR